MDADALGERLLGQAVLFAQEFGTIAPGPVYSKVPNTVVSAQTTDTTTVVTDNGRYDQVSIILNDLAGTFIYGSLHSQTLTLLHELGHAMDYIFGSQTNKFKPDSGDPTISGNNDSLVTSNCKFN